MIEPRPSNLEVGTRVRRLPLHISALSVSHRATEKAVAASSRLLSHETCSRRLWPHSVIGSRPDGGLLELARVTAIQRIYVNQALAESAGEAAVRGNSPPSLLPPPQEG